MGLGEGWAKGRLGLDGHFKVNFSQFWSMFGQNRTIFDHSDVMLVIFGIGWSFKGECWSFWVDVGSN